MNCKKTSATAWQTKGAASTKALRLGSVVSQIGRQQDLRSAGRGEVRSGLVQFRPLRTKTWELELGLKQF